MDIKIVFHPSGDWEGLYVDGVLETEGHSIYTHDIIDLMLKKELLKQYSSRDLGNEEGFDEDFSFPLKYEDIKV